MTSAGGALAARPRLLAASLAVALSGCVTPGAAEGDLAPIDEVELQEGLERVASSFMAATTQAVAPLVGPDSPPRQRALAMRQLLLYQSSVLDLATGRFPEVNLLDMLAFMDLAAAALEEYWLPEVFGDAGRPLVDAFSSSEQELERLARRVMTPAQLEEVHQLVRDWRRENPAQRQIETVRLFAFAETAGRLASERDRRTRGLLSSVKSATRSADAAVLLGERAMFLAQRVPFLLQLHARLAMHNLAAEGALLLEEAEDALGRAADLRPLLDDASRLAARAGEAARDARGLIHELQPLLDVQGDPPLRVEQLVASTDQLLDASSSLVDDLGRVDRTLTSAHHLVDRATTVVEDARVLVLDPHAERRLDALVRRWLAYVGLLAALLVVVLWSGWVVARRLTRDEAAPGAAPAGREPARPSARR